MNSSTSGWLVLTRNFVAGSHPQNDRHEANNPNYKVHIKWWLNHGAVGGGDSVRMPFDGYLKSLDWCSHPWAMAHEMLHTFGLGHSHEMDRLDREIQEYMDYQRWYFADHPEYEAE